MLAVAAAACVALGAQANAAPAVARDTGGAPPARTSLWSPRRVPAVFVDAVAISRLHTQLAAVVAPYSACVTVSRQSSSLVRINPQRPLAAASTQKLLVAAAALSVLGGTHRFTTRAVSTSSPKAGALSGDLTVVGAGDPVLTTESAPISPATRLSDLADAIVRAGVRQIDGALVADDNRYDHEREIPDWKPSELDEGDVGALGALVVNGGRAIGGNAPSADPELDTVQQLAGMLEARGVQISGGVRDADTSASLAGTHEIARVSSPPLASIVEQMLTFSNNETAELLTREISAATGGSGSTEGGTNAMHVVLRHLGVPVTNIELHDGSGLAPDDRVTCDALLHVIELSARPAFAAIAVGLPVAGETGTLAGRFIGTPLAGHLRAKTGHIDGVVGLSGEIEGAAPSATVRFSFIANGAFSTDGGDNLQDAIATTIATYPSAPAGAALVPAP